MKVGIIGFARSGKTTAFNALTGARADVGAFGSRDANVAVLKVPDPRVDALAKVYQPEKVVYAEFQFVDVAPNAAATDDKALDSAALTVLKNIEALVHVVRAFDNDEVVHPNGSVDPVRDCKALEEELRFDDLVIIERRLERLEKENRKDLEYNLLKRCGRHIESGQALRTLELTPQEAKVVNGFMFLSRKPLLLLGNYGEDRIDEEDPAGLEAYASEAGFPHIDLCGAIEMEVALLPGDEAQAFREEYGLGEGSRTRFIHSAYDMLGMISFLTVGKPAAQAWTIPKGTPAVQAAGAIHTDMQRGFIRAEVVSFDHFAAAGSMPKAKEAGHVRLEGKDYIVQDGDIILFLFNV